MEIEETQGVEPGPITFAFRALKIKNFRLFFIGQSISLVGTWSQAIALSWLTWRLTNSAWWLGFVGFATQIPVLFLGLVGGFVADRYSRLPLLILMQVLCMLQAVILSVITYMGYADLTHIVLLSFSLGVIYAFEFPLRQAFVMDMVGEKELINAISLNSAMIHATRILGPMMAGFIIGWWSEAVCFAINAVSFVFLIAALFIIDRTSLIKQEVDGAKMLSAIRNGVSYMWSSPAVKAILVLVTVISGFGMTYVSLLPLFVGRIYNSDAVSLGVLMGAGAAGALAGALYLAKRKTMDGLFALIIKNALAFSVLIIIFSQIKVVYPAALFLMASAFFLTIVFSAANTFLQKKAPNHLRGRMMSFFTVTFFGLAPIGSIVGGAVAEAFGAPLTVMASGIVCLLTAIIFMRKVNGRKNT